MQKLFKGRRDTNTSLKCDDRKIEEQNVTKAIGECTYCTCEADVNA